MNSNFVSCATGTLGLAKYGLTEIIFSFLFTIVLHIQLDIVYLAFCYYLDHQFFNHRCRADGILIPVLRKAMNVMPHAKRHQQRRKINKTHWTPTSLF